MIINDYIMPMYDYVCLCMAMYDYVWLCVTMYDNVWLCMTMYDWKDMDNAAVMNVLTKKFQLILTAT